MKKQELFIGIAFLLVLVTRVSAQNQRLLGSNALVYELPKITTVPPLYPGQPIDVSEAYLLFDEGLRQSNLGGTDHYFQRMGYGDTSKYIVNLIYRVDDDNPLSFFSYCTESSSSYLTGPGYAFASFSQNIPRMYQDSGITDLLVLSDIISDIRVTDTARTLDTLSSSPLRIVAVTCQILDEIKGKMVPQCPSDLYGQKKSGIHPLSTAPFLTSAVAADTGGCLQFQYSLDWYSDTVGYSLHKLGDSVNGDWIRKDSEYIVFLRLSFLTSDTSQHDYFTISPIIGGACVGMYPVRNGLVYDPRNDFGFGLGLTPNEFKTQLRARIYALTNP